MSLKNMTSRNLFNRQPEISVIVPVFNCEDYLRGLLDSLINQTYHDFEVILVDDGSTDNSGGICDDYSSRFSNIKVLHKGNSGVSSARNSGLKIANGKYVAFADSDDYVSPYWLETMSADIGDCDQLICDFRQGTRSCFSLSNLGKDNHRGGHKVTVSRTDEDFRHNISEIDRWCFGAVWRQLFRRSIIIEHNIEFPESQMEDIIFSYTFFVHAESVVKSSYDGYYYIHNEGSLSASHQAIVEYPWLRRMEDLHDKFIRKHNLKDDKGYFSILARRFSVIAASYILKGYYTDTRMKRRERLERWRRIHSDKYFKGLYIREVSDRRTKLVMCICRYQLYFLFDPLFILAANILHY